MIPLLMSLDSHASILNGDKLKLEKTESMLRTRGPEFNRNVALTLVSVSINLVRPKQIILQLMTPRASNDVGRISALHHTQNFKSKIV